MVARDGLEPPTPAFSGPLSQHGNMFRIRIIAWFQRLRETGFVIGWADVGRFGIVDVRYLYIDVWTSCAQAGMLFFGVGHKALA